jgi:hypothetical protein
VSLAYSLWARLLLPALVFSLLHVAVEPFSLDAFRGYIGPDGVPSVSIFKE